jgi:hypothetical protein
VNCTPPACSRNPLPTRPQPIPLPCNEVACTHEWPCGVAEDPQCNASLQPKRSIEREVLATSLASAPTRSVHFKRAERELVASKTLASRGSKQRAVDRGHSWSPGAISAACTGPYHRFNVRHHSPAPLPASLAGRRTMNVGSCNEPCLPWLVVLLVNVHHDRTIFVLDHGL